MRPLWLCLALLIVLPARAADKTVVVRLRHTPAGELERRLLPEQYPSPVPAGITAWTVDERHNALVVTGNEAALGEFQHFVRLIDTPKGRVRLAVRWLDLDARERRQMADAPVGGVTETASVGVTALLRKEQIAAWEARPAIAASEMVVSNNYPLHLRWPASPGVPPVMATVMPRVNGNGTVTLFFSFNEPRIVKEAALGTTFTVVRRLPTGTAALAVPRPGSLTLLVVIQNVLPVSQPAGGQR